MKFKLTRKQLAVIILLIIIVPIIYNKTSGFIIGVLQKQAMRMPKEVVVDNPHIEKVNVSAESTGRVEAQYSIDVIARVSGFLLKKYFKEVCSIDDKIKGLPNIPKEYLPDFKLVVNKAIIPTDKELENNKQ